ncbi:MAG: Ig-like domain-containing protein [bacterium]
MNVIKTGWGLLTAGLAVVCLVFGTGGVAWSAPFHYQTNCTACHDLSGSSQNLAGISETINGENVVFQIKPDHYADGSGSRICEVCHTSTNYYRTDGTSPRGSHYTGQDCSACHFHCGEFFHNGGSGTGCISCHGHDSGYEYEPGQTSPGAGSFISHSTHTEHDSDDLRGPCIDCAACHDTANYPFFKSGTDSNGDGHFNLSETDVCDGCHSPAGAYDGVDDPVIGAKANWQSGVYQQPQGQDLQSGRENWCAGCHDDGISVSEGISAPNVMGDNATYGYNITGHKITCSACHTVTTAHIDGDARTYAHGSDPFNPDDPHNYQNGYRLKYSMTIPLGVGPLGGSGANRFTLCFTCHNYDRIMGSTAPFMTNFQDDGVNRHRAHITSGRVAWDSDWDYRLVPDEIIVDNLNAVFVGDWPSSTVIGGYYGTDYQWHAAGDGTSTAAWIPLLPQNREYKVYARWPASAEHASNAQYSIVYSGGTYTGTVNQQINGNTWTLLGTFSFIEGSSGYVQLSDLANGIVVADAVKFGDALIDSRLSCPACHNVHGAPNPVMIRHGELISTPGTEDKVPALSFRWYKQDGFTPTIFGEESAYGDMPVLGGVGGGALEDTGVCVACHAGPSTIKYDRTYQALDKPAGTWARPVLPPSIRLLNPQPGSEGVAVDSNLSLLLLSNGQDALDWSTFSISLQGDLSYSQTYTDEDTGIVSVTGTSSRYQVTVNPATNFSDQEHITITVSIQDVGGHSLTPPAWDFTTGVSSPVIWRTPQAVHSEYLFWLPECLIDDHPETGNMYVPFADHWVIFDLGQSCQVTQIRLLLSATRQWNIFVSDDPAAFGTAVKANWLAQADPAGTGTAVTPKQGRYLKLFTGMGPLEVNTLLEVDVATEN